MPTPMTAGVTQQGSSVDGKVWHILGQTYTPLSLTESSFSWHALLPPGTFVPPHVHPTQDEFIYMLEGKFDLLLDGQAATAKAGDLIRLPRCIPHGLFNKTEANITCIFWVVADAQAVGPVPRDRQRARPGRGGASRRHARGGVHAASVTANGRATSAACTPRGTQRGRFTCSRAKPAIEA